MIRRRWDLQCWWNGWLSVGFHFDHTDPSLTLHLPLVGFAFGRLKQPGHPWSIRGTPNVARALHGRDA